MLLRTDREFSDAWQLRMEEVGQDPQGGRRFVAYLRPLRVVAPGLFEQPSLFGGGLDPEDTALDWLGDVVAAVRREERNSALLDRELLARLAEFRRMARQGLTEAEITTRRYAPDPIRFDSAFGELAGELRETFPLDQTVQIAGFLGRMGFPKRSYLLDVGGGQDLRVYWEWLPRDTVDALVGTQVVVEGTIQFRPSGQPMALLANRVRPATAQDQALRALPRARPPHRGQPRLRQGEKNPLAKLRGVLDGQVTDEEFTKMVEAFGRE